MVARRQFWLGPPRAGQTVRFWASVDVIHLSIAGARVKSLRSHLSPPISWRSLRTARSRPVRHRSRSMPTGRRSRSTARSITAGSSLLAGRQVLAAEILGGRPVIVRIEPQTLMFLDPDTRELLRPAPTRSRASSRSAARRAPGRPATATTDRAGHRSAPRQRHRRDRRLPPTRLARTRPRRPHRHRSRLRAHARYRARRRNPDRPTHHQPARRRRQGQPAAPSPGNVNRTLMPARDRKRSIPNRSRT